MELKSIIEKMIKSNQWEAPDIIGDIPHGDMPGDKIQISEVHIKKANVIFPELLVRMMTLLEKRECQKLVLTVCGGSGVGKSEIASLLSYYLNQMGIGSYTLSGDNYPHRIPLYNDAERMRVFRHSAIKGMIKAGTYKEERFNIIHQFQQENDDANAEHLKDYPWYESYLLSGREGLMEYLGTRHEIAYEEIEEILSQFKSGKKEIWLKRMGRKDTELWYNKFDFSGIDVLIVEWTHGNSDNYQGVDIPILLNSMPQETLAHRRTRNRDGATDSPFTVLVLELEQEMLVSQARKAQIILSKSGELISYDQYWKQMEGNKGGINEQ
ncbi:MAG: hypothetical protein K0R23_1039 [Lacrimispora sp.]|jgi:alpha-galactosidase|nr:hypothetical protein [Lacrimispora sp.]